MKKFLSLVLALVMGTVPDTYTYFSTDPDTYEEDLKDYILNNS